MTHLLITLWAILFDALPYIATTNLVLTTIILINQLRRKK